MLTHPLFLAFAGLTAVLFIIGSGIDAYEKRRGRKLDLPNWAANSLTIIVGAWLLGAAIIFAKSPFVVGFVALTVALVLIGLGIDAYETRRGRELDLPNWAGNILAILVGAWLLGAAIILLVIFLGISGGGPYGSGAIYGD